MNSEDSYQSKRIAKYFLSKKYDDVSYQEINNLLVFSKGGSYVKCFYCDKAIMGMIFDDLMRVDVSLSSYCTPMLLRVEMNRHLGLPATP